MTDDKEAGASVPSIKLDNTLVAQPDVIKPRFPNVVFGRPKATSLSGAYVRESIRETTKRVQLISPTTRYTVNYNVKDNFGKMKHLLFILVFYMLIFGFVFYRQDALPEPQSHSVPLDQFSESRAEQNLRFLAETIGPRVVGSQNENKTFDFLLSKIKQAKNLAKEDVVVEIDIQNVSGHLRHHLRKFVITYANVTNIIVRVRPKRQARYWDQALLLSSHYDTGHTSPGCHDDGLPNVVMLESLQNLLHSTSGASMLRPVIFLFNGGEEITLCAAHGFVNQHPWINETAMFLNLEAAGTGGRPIVFQSTDSWIMTEYAKANTNSWGSVGGQDIFQSNVVPSDTDYRIFAEAGLLGIDTAFYRNGHTYHTSKETCDLLTPGSIQEMGENTLRFVKHMIALDVSVPKKAILDKSVYFDLNGYYMFVAGASSFHIVCAALLFVCFIEFFRMCDPIDNYLTYATQKVLKTIVVLTFAFVSSVVASLACSCILVFAFNKPLSFFGQHPYFPLLLYGLPSIIGILLPLWYFTKDVNQRSVYAVVFGGWTILLAIATFYRLGIAYVPFVIALSLIPDWGNNIPFSHYIKLAPAMCMLMFMTLAMLDLFVPIMGRFGNKPADLIISVLTSVLVFALMSPMLPMFYTDKKNQHNPRYSTTTKVYMPKALFPALIQIIFGLVVLSAFALQPYTEYRPKRLLVEHVQEYVSYPNVGYTSGVVSSTTGQKISQTYMGVSSLDHVPETFVEKHLTQKYSYSQRPLYFIATCGTPINRTNEYFTSPTEHVDNMKTPVVSVQYNKEESRLYVSLDTTSVTSFSHELWIYSKEPFESSSFENSTEIVTNTGLYKFGWIRFQGATHDASDKIQRVWVSTTDTKKQIFGGIVGVKVVSTELETENYSTIMNNTLNALPKEIAAAPAMISVIKMHFGENVQIE
jgi:hypothetical protein